MYHFLQYEIFTLAIVLGHCPLNIQSSSYLAIDTCLHSLIYLSTEHLYFLSTAQSTVVTVDLRCEHDILLSVKSFGIIQAWVHLA